MRGSAVRSADDSQLIHPIQAEPKMLNRLKTIAACAAAVVIAGCGGGGNDQAAGYTVDSGAAQKGPLAQGSAVFVNELTAATLQPNGKEYTFRTSNNLGAFSTAGITFTTNYLSTMAWGYYFDEITGKQSTDVVALTGLSQIGTNYDTVINVNALSSMAVNRITALVTKTSPLTFTAARLQAQKDLLGAFYIYNGASILTGATVNNIAQPANLTALDLSKNRPGDQMLAAVSGVVMTAGANGNGVNTLLSQIAVDLGDDGLLNNSPNYTPSVSTQLCAAAAVTDFGVVAANLNRVYGSSYTAATLSQWVDTSGCVDKVIDKNKFAAADVVVALGVESKGPAYIAGPDDIRQCFSVGGVKPGATAKLYYKGSTTAVLGTQKAALGDSLFLGITAGSVGTYSAFIHRSAPTSSGVCPTTAPTSELARVMQYRSAFGSGTVAVSTLAGSGQGSWENGTGASASFNIPQGVAVGANGVVYVADFFNSAIRKITPAGAASTLAENVYRPIGVAVDGKGVVYFADIVNHVVRKVSADGTVSILAGSGTKGSADGTGASASFNNPSGIAVDANGVVYVADAFNHKIRKITASGVVSTLAGSGAEGSADGSASSASFSTPTGVAVSANGVVYVADMYNHKIRKITAAGVVTTIAGSGAGGSSEGAGASASFLYPTGIAIDTYGVVYVADTYNQKIRKITAAGVVSTIAGSGSQGSRDGDGANASFLYPKAVAVDASGTLYVADTNNHKIRKITPQ